MLMLILILDPQVPNWMWMTLILPSQSGSKPKGTNEMVIICLVDLLLADQDTLSTAIVRNMMMIYLLSP